MSYTAPTMPSGLIADEAAEESARAFVVIRHGSRTWVTNLTKDEPITFGRSPEANIRVYAPELAPIHAHLRWDGQRIMLTDDAGPTYVNGKPVASNCELKAGDEVGMGPCHVVVGIATQPIVGGRRALTHEEFRERLWEELARAARGGRPTCMVLLQARPGEGRKLTEVALRSFRTGDLVGAYAHDEIEVLLPDTDGHVGQAVVSRVIQNSGREVVFGFAVAPADAENHERLLRAARAALDHAKAENRPFSSPPPRKRKGTVVPTTRDPATRRLLAAIEAVAPTDQPCLFNGELSSGKAVFARLLHDRSPRASAAFVSISCAGSRQRLADAFHLETGKATRARGGTLFLDEVADLPPDVQVAARTLLTTYRDIRPVAGTQRALAGLVERGAFDRDLFACLSGQVLEVPALRNRPDDILPLAEKFAVDAGATAPVRMAPGAIARLRSYPWPGNVLELHNAIDRAVRLANDGEILAEHLPSEALPASSGEGALREHVDSVERDAIIRALADSNHNQTHAAKRLGISRRALIYKMEKYGLKRPPRGIRRPRTN